MNILSNLQKWIPVRYAEAHCDIPCGIYDPISAKIAAQTVLKMVMRIQSLKAPSVDTTASLGRYILVKEEHAEITKQEIDILWHDYFKPEHLDKHPDLHTKVWETTKLASQNKQSVDLEAAQKLVEAVDDIASIYWATKGVDYDDKMSTIRFGT